MATQKSQEYGEHAGNMHDINMNIWPFLLDYRLYKWPTSTEF